MTDLTDKYRPVTFKEVVGHRVVIKSLADVVDRKAKHAFLFCGPSGVGKTTLARIAATTLGAAPQAILEIDAASNTGIDAMREVMASARLRPLNGAVKAIIIDEAHALSKNAWDSMLKSVEEPPEHLFWFFCTTEPTKVPKAIKTRCHSSVLDEVSHEDIEGLLNDVIEDEKIDIPDEVYDVVVKQSNGSPRQALVNLEACRSLSTRREAAEALQAVLDSDPVHALCQMMVSAKGSWQTAMGLVEKMGTTNPESVRIVVVNYIAAVLRNTNTDKKAEALLDVLDAFSTPYSQSEKQAPLLLSIGRVLLGN